MVYGIDPRKKEFQGSCLVAFIDILGFSTEIKENWSDIENNPFDRLKRFVNRVNHGISKQLKEFEVEDGQGTYYKCKVKMFSDSIIVTYGFDEKIDKYKFIIGLYYILCAVSQVWKIALRYNYTVRGGLEYGEMRWDEKTFAGPAFVDAYVIESKQAISSRVVFGSNLGKWIYDNLGQKQNIDNPKEILFTHLKNIIRPYLYLDCDKSIILSPHSLYKKLPERDRLIKQLTAMQNKCTTLNTILKYTPLLTILTSEIKRFSDEDIQVLKAKYDHATPTT